MSRCSFFSIDTDARYNKADKATHRFDIADTRGPLSLTVPVSRPSGAWQWSQVLVSDHGRWWETMPIALESAYGRTPYFEFYIDRLMPLFTPGQRPLSQLCAQADEQVRHMLGIKAIEKEPDTTFTRYNPDAFNHAGLEPYWQLRQQQFGFIPDLSVLDLIFNLGPEAQIYLQRLSTHYVDNC